ncbi:hypothetical protein SAMN05428969_2843 [Devosia sp. YR412]|uniref:hypothetical protein n=1 Tax=Devosia sp. YR412 TaxID=1881030 RepID=UPI0008BA94FB|nr:hypothetical protein [Devosia sp. YR412]SEQ38193.1 hypothetical protein SAMN05428969_2843 [Devosia sp. YR412]
MTTKTEIDKPKAPSSLGLPIYEDYEQVGEILLEGDLADHRLVLEGDEAEVTNNGK